MNLKRLEKKHKRETKCAAFLIVAKPFAYKHLQKLIERETLLVCKTL